MWSVWPIVTRQNACNLAFCFAARSERQHKRHRYFLLTIRAIPDWSKNCPLCALSMNFWKSRSTALMRHRDLRHQFVIGPLCKSTLSSDKARLYYCLKCKWTFQVCGRNVAVLDECGEPVVGEESLRRFHTFEEGLCPVLESFAAAAAAVAPNPLPLLRRKSDECVDLASSYVSARPRRIRPVLRLLTGLREDLGRPS
jgi:hypothetical protein